MSSNLFRGFASLELLVKHVDGLPLRTIAEKLNISRSTAHRMLAELIECGYVRQDAEFSPYRLTFKFASLGLVHLSHTGVAELVQPVIDKLANASGELVRISLVEGDRLIWVAMAQGARGGLRYDATSGPGEEVRLFCSSNGLAWMSFLSDEKALEIVSRQGWGEPGRYGPNAPRSIQAFLGKLHETRERGYATTQDAYENGISNMAAAVLHQENKRPIGALSIAGPTSRLTSARMEELAPLLLAAASELTACSTGICALTK